jgi:polyphosphate kinase 2
MIDQLDRIKAEIADSFDEELEMQMEEDRLDELVAEGMSEEAEPTLDRKIYFRELFRLQHELVRLQDWVQYKKLKVVVLFEGRDSAGKGGAIKRVTQRLNPRVCRTVALPAPTEREKNQWYFQRYVPHLPSAGEMVLFDRSWYNRAGVERVMGFCSPEELDEFFRTVPEFERMLVRSGIILIKYWFSITDEEQEFRFQMRIHDPLKQWKLSPMDMESRVHWEDYTKPLGGLSRPSTRRRPASTASPTCSPRSRTRTCRNQTSSCRNASATTTTNAARFRWNCTCPKSIDRITMTRPESRVTSLSLYRFGALPSPPSSSPSWRGSSDPTSVGSKDSSSHKANSSLAAQTRGGWIPVTRTGMTAEGKTPTSTCGGVPKPYPDAVRLPQAAAPHSSPPPPDTPPAAPQTPSAPAPAHPDASCAIPP